MRRSRLSLLLMLLGLSIGSSACGVGDAELSALGDGAEAPADAQERDPIPAGGISIVEVELNQGTRVPIGVGAAWVMEDARAGVAIASRDAVLRVHYSVDADWIPREIEARLTLVDAEGVSRSFVDARMVAGSSARGDVEGPFSFRLATDEGHTLAGTEYQIELWDQQPSLGEGLAQHDWVNPATGPMPIGFQAVPLQIKLVMVPIDYGGDVLSLDEDLQLDIVNNLYEQNPVTEVVWDVHPPVAYGGQLGSLSSLLPLMAQLRADDGAQPNVYYHALVDVGSQSLGGVHGISYAANETKDDAGSRVSATVVWSVDPRIAVETFTHETGHAQGLAHVQCPSAVAEDPDPSFPHADGLIGEWGVGVQGLEVYDPAKVYDYMSYCGPTWVSDWTWTKTYARIEALSAWDFEGPAVPGERTQLLVGAVSGDSDAEASSQWWTMPGAVDPRRSSALERVEFELADGQRIVAPADVSELSDGHTRWIKVALPAELGQLRAITYVAGAHAQQIEPASLVRAGSAGPSWRPSWRSRF